MAPPAKDAQGGHLFSLRFLIGEWEQVVDAWQLHSWEEYRDVVRLGRKTRLKEPQRLVVWGILHRVQDQLNTEGLITFSAMFDRLAKHYGSGAVSPFDFIVADEAQDVGVTQLRFLAAMAANRRNGLFFSGDVGQRIFQQPFSWKAQGVDLRGRSTTLKVNYRTSHQIRIQADRLLDKELSDVDGNVEDRKGTISLFDGPLPEISRSNSEEKEQAAVAAWILKRIADGVRPDEVVIFVRTVAQLARAELAANLAGTASKVLDTHMETTVGHISISTMHMAKGLEFRSVAIMACDDEIIPLRERIDDVQDVSELEDVYNTERQLLYVACTRARDNLF